jgi:hypothetical protein
MLTAVAAFSICVVRSMDLANSNIAIALTFWKFIFLTSQYKQSTATGATVQTRID